MRSTALKLRHLLWLLPFLAVSFAQATPLSDPEPVMVPAGLGTDAVAKAIRLGSVKHGWMITRDDPGRMEATLHVRVHTVKVGIEYDTQTVRIKYVSSENMEYAEKNGQQHIHGNYNKWVRTLAVDISGQLVQMPAAAK